MRKPIRTAITIATMGTMLVCAYLLGTIQSETTGIQAMTAVRSIMDGKYIMDAAVFQDGYEHYVDMQQVIDFEVSADGLQLYFADGTGYYWER